MGQALSPRPVSLPWHPPPPLSPSPEQLNSFFWISATLRPRSWAGAAHWVKSPMVGRWRSHCESQARWQSQKRWLECRRLQVDGAVSGHGTAPAHPTALWLPQPGSSQRLGAYRGGHGGAREHLCQLPRLPCLVVLGDALQGCPLHPLPTVLSQHC